MRKWTLFFILIGVLILAACNDEDKAEETVEKDIKELVQEYSTGDFENISASITSSELIVTYEDDEKEVYQLPEDEFFLSIAPFIEVTHPCANHSLTGCQGELVNEAFEVEIIDSEGNIVLNETLQTMDNGFIDLWLPRNDEYAVTITQDGKVAEETISTYDGDNTCITTMQLKDM